MSAVKKPIYLLAGRGEKVPDPLIAVLFRENGVASPTIACVGTANGDDPDFLSRMTAAFCQSGAGSVHHAVITPRDADIARARALLEAADLVFVSGGDVDQGMRRLAEKGMIPFLLRLYGQAKSFFGLPAGSIMLASEWVRWRDPDDDATAELFPCLGMAPLLCDAHDEEGDWQELKTALQLRQDGATGYGIVSGRAIKVYPDGRVEAVGGAVHRYLRQGMGVVQLPDLLPVNDG
jgi:peptidase E